MSLPPLYVQTLGGFLVRRGDTPLPDTAWSREKARSLFQYLVTQHTRLLAREYLIEDLWPELSPESGQRDFKVALNALSTALEPERPPKTLTGYLLRQGTSYGVHPVAPVRIDFVDFEASLAAASRAEEERDTETATLRYREALALYRGEYLPDALYQDWTTATRERLATLYLQGATRLASLLLARGAFMEVAIWCERILGADALWEDAYRLLMSAYLAQGNRPLALRTYERCESALRRELGVGPMAATKALYTSARNSL